MVSLFFAIKRDFFSNQLNEVSPEWYIELYNHFARVRHLPILRTEDDIYTDRNKFKSLVEYTLFRSDPFYAFLNRWFDEYLRGE